LGFLVDTHCHLNLSQFDADRDEVLARARSAGIQQILIPGIDLETSRSALEFAQNHALVYTAAGVHPNEIENWPENCLDELSKLVEHPQVVAIGEIGLDYYRHFTDPEKQKNIFTNQLNLAGRVNLPVIVHCRDAAQDCLSILFTWQEGLARDQSSLADRPGVLHGFAGSLADAKAAVAHHFCIGIGGPITYPSSAERRQWLAELPIESILTETDAPYLAPQSIRGKRNEPANIRVIAETLAAVYYQSLEFVEVVTSHNAARLFAWRV
jgi:TatD DNase family protein